MVEPEELETDSEEGEEEIMIAPESLEKIIDPMRKVMKLMMSSERLNSWEEEDETS